ncbi:MAG: hypothetical protein J0L87_11595 [Bacteroidetes bacterium]|nr:hypothetical protein [Bacteroidota bacterium]
MEESIGDKIFNFSCVILGGTFIFGWIILIGFMFLQWMLPKFEGKFEFLLLKFSAPLSIIQKYSFYCIILLLILRLIASWLGWATPLSGSGGG